MAELEAIAANIDDATTSTLPPPSQQPRPPVGGGLPSGVGDGFAPTTSALQGPAVGKSSSAVSSVVQHVDVPSGVPGGVMGHLPVPTVQFSQPALQPAQTTTFHSLQTPIMQNTHNNNNNNTLNPSSYSQASSSSHGYQLSTNSTGHFTNSPGHFSGHQYTTPSAQLNRQNSLESLTTASQQSITKNEDFNAVFAASMSLNSSDQSTAVGLCHVTNPDSLCRGLIGDGSTWCTKDVEDCNTNSHQKHKCDIGKGYWIRSTKRGRALVGEEHFLSQSDADRDPDLLALVESRPKFGAPFWMVAFKKAVADRMMEGEEVRTPSIKRKFDGLKSSVGESGSGIATTPTKRFNFGVTEESLTDTAVVKEMLENVGAELVVVDGKVELVSASLGSKPSAHADQTVWGAISKISGENAVVATTAATASSKAEQALTIANGFTMSGEPTNPTTQEITSLRTSVDTALHHNATLRQQNAVLAKALQTLLNKSNPTPTTTQPHQPSTTPPTNQSQWVTQADLDLQVRLLTAEVTSVKNELDGVTPFVNGTITIASLSDAKDFITNHCPIDCLECWNSIFLFLCGAGKSTTVPTDANSLELAALKLGRNTAQLTKVNDRKLPAPPIFKADVGGHFTALKTYSDFDGGDGKSGIMDVIDQYLERWTREQNSLMDVVFGSDTRYAKGKELALYLISHVQLYVSRIRAEVSKIYTLRLNRLAGGGDATPTAHHKESAWAPTKDIFESIMRKVSNISLQACHSGSIPGATDRSASFLWVALQEHQVWLSYGSHPTFTDHKHLHSTTVKHLEENLHPKATAARDKAAMEKRLTAAEKELADLKKALTKANSAIGNLKDGQKTGGPRGVGKKKKADDEAAAESDNP